MEETIRFIGLDVHEKTIAVAFADGALGGEARYFGTIANRPEALRRLVERLWRADRELRLCDEAGPCGYGVYRLLSGLGHDCVVVAPSLIPRRPGDRVKTDRRDALRLARLHRAGELTAVWAPDAAHEAMRDLDAGASRHGRGRLELPPAGQDHPPPPRSPGRIARGGPRHRLERATPALRALSPPDRRRQTEPGGDRRRRPRDARLRLGHRARPSS